MTQKVRLDQLLVERELVETRSKAKALVMAGEVLVDGHRCDKAGTLVAPEANVQVRTPMKYVSRGGLKLEAALDAFGYDCADKIVIDVGASTGGFTDCVLQHGARRVYSVDVGYGQLAWKLREDPRVVVLERANIRHLPADAIAEPCDLAVVDCSFISLELVLPNTKTFLAPGGDVIALVKPQFEAGPQNVGKGGVVRDLDVREDAISRVLASAAALGFELADRVESPVHGPAGNIEELVWLRWTGG